MSSSDIPKLSRTSVKPKHKRYLCIGWILLHKHTLCTETDRGSSSLCSSLTGLNSTIQLRIDNYQPAQACPWKFHNPVYANVSWWYREYRFPKASQTCSDFENAWKMKSLFRYVAPKIKSSSYLLMLNITWTVCKDSK